MSETSWLDAGCHHASEEEKQTQEKQTSNIFDGARDRLRSSINSIRDRITTSETSFLHWLMHEGLEEDVVFALQLLNDQDLFPLPPPNHKALIEQHASARASLGGRRSSSISEVSQDFAVLPTTTCSTTDIEDELDELKINAEDDDQKAILDDSSCGEDLALSTMSIAPVLKNDGLLPRSVSEGPSPTNKMVHGSNRATIGAATTSRGTNTGRRALTRSHSLPSMKLVDMEKRVKHIQKRRASTRLSRVGLWKAHQGMFCSSTIIHFSFVNRSSITLQCARRICYLTLPAYFHCFCSYVHWIDRRGSSSDTTTTQY